MNKTNHWLAAIACITAGVSIAALPHLLAWIKTGRPDYVATVDDRYYLALGSQAYFNHPGTLADPVHAGQAPCIFRPLPFLPGVWAAKILDLGPLGINMMWRVIGGAMAGLGWYLLFCQRIPRPWVAACLSLILLSDPGLCQGFPFARHLSRTIQIASASRDAIFPGGHWMHLEWRVVNPATTMVYLIAVMWAVTRARAVPTRGRIALAGLTVGLLFYVYFYYWTAVGLGLLIAMALDAGHRRVYFHAGWIGGVLGLPAVISDYLMKQYLTFDYHLRNDRFVPIGRFAELELPPEVLVILVLGAALVWRRRRDLIFVWSLGTAGLMLANEQIVTGLQLSNYHWMYVWGPAFAFFVVQAAAEEFGGRLNWSPRSCAVLAIIGLGAFGVGMRIRAVEATRSKDPVHTAKMIAAYRDAFSPGESSLFFPNSVAAGNTDFVELAAILDNLRPLCDWSAHNSPTMTDAELDERTALNELLLGTDRAAFETRQRDYYETFQDGPCKRDRSLIPVRVAARLAAYDHAGADLGAALSRFKVRYVGLRVGNRPAYLAHGWKLLVAGPTWDVWERSAD
jgi:hypothetical protein